MDHILFRVNIEINILLSREEMKWKKKNNNPKIIKVTEN